MLFRSDGEVDFLRWVLRANPAERPNALQILASGWLNKTDAEVARGFTPPERATLAYDSSRTGAVPSSAPSAAPSAAPSTQIGASQRTSSVGLNTGFSPASSLTAPRQVGDVGSKSDSRPVSTSGAPQSIVRPQVGSEKVSFFSGEPGSNFFAGRPSPYASKP